MTAIALYTVYRMISDFVRSLHKDDVRIVAIIIPQTSYPEALDMQLVYWKKRADDVTSFWRDSHRVGKYAFVFLGPCKDQSDDFVPVDTKIATMM